MQSELPAEAAELIRRLDLGAHPEGGYFRETYRSATLDAQGRAASTMIYFLLPQGHVSRLHRIDADEGWHLYLGGPLDIYEFDEADARADARTTRLGTRLEQGERMQYLVPARRWFGAALAPEATFALVGCTVAPGFEFGGFELGDRSTLLNRFPVDAALIRRLTR